MTLQGFCVAHGFPLTHTQRKTREIARHVFKQRGDASRDLKDIGLKVTRAGKSRRFSYNVYDPDRFKRAMTRVLGPDKLLTTGQLDVLIGAARMLHSEYQGNQPPEAARYAEQLGRVLRRVGAL